MMNSSYQSLFTSLENKFDEALFILWIRKNPYAPWIICALYTAVVLGTHKWMRNRPPVQFGPYVLPTWNALFAITNLLVFVKVAPARLSVLWNQGIAHSSCHFYSHVGPVAFWNCVYFFSKFVWLIDTMFIVLRKKTLTSFRFFHHISALVYTWYMFSERQGMTWLTFPNALTTTVFYGIPMLTSLVPSTTRAASVYMIFASISELGYIFCKQSLEEFYDILVFHDKQFCQIWQIRQI